MKPIAAIEQNDRPRGMGRDCFATAPYGKILANNDGRAIVVANDFFNERTDWVIWGGAVGDDARTNFKAQVDWFSWVERHYFVSNFDFHRSAGVVTKTKLDRG